jgi:hypothetical protein
VLSYLILTLLAPIDSSSTSARQRTYRFHGGPYTWREIFETLRQITGYEYDVTYIPVEQALDLEKEARRLEMWSWNSRPAIN